MRLNGPAVIVLVDYTFKVGESPWTMVIYESLPISGLIELMK